MFKRGVTGKHRCLPSKDLRVNTLLERGPDPSRHLPPISVPPRLHSPASVTLETFLVLYSVGLRIPLVWGLGVGVYGAGFWVLGFMFRVSGLGFRFWVQSLGFRVEGSEFRV